MISIIVPLFNKEKTISLLINSIIEQTFINWELIIVDDGSTDSSSSIVKPYLNDSRIIYVYKSNGGVSSARNRGIKEAKGEWLVFMDADDYFLPNALESLYKVVTKFGTKMAVSNFIYKDKEVMKTYLCTRKEGIISNNYRAWIFRTSFPRAGAAIYHRTLLENNLFDESLCRFEDAQHVFNIMRHTKVARTLDCTMVYECDYNSLSKIEEHPEKDFVMHMDFKGKSCWEKIALAMLLVSGLSFYPCHKEFLLNKYKEYKVWLKVAEVVFRLRSFYLKIYNNLYDKKYTEIYSV